MLLYHGSRWRFDFPSYGEASERSGGFPLGLFASPAKNEAFRYGHHLYEFILSKPPVLLRDDALLKRPRHIHVRDGRDAMITRDRQTVVIINFDAIESFRYIGSRQRLEIVDPDWSAINVRS